MASSAERAKRESIQACFTKAFFTDLQRFKNPIDINFEFSDDLPERIVWPKEACTQIMIQLIRNALQASSHRSPIAIKVSSDAQFIMVKIIDQGKGMTNEILRRAGEPFFTTRLNDGMGLGLFIAKSLIERLNGSFMLSSEVNHGTQVTVSLPSHIRAYKTSSNR